jgi:rubrerythrin
MSLRLAIVTTLTVLLAFAAAQAAKLNPDTEAALVRALDDEWRSRATYEAVIAGHGETRPFVHIVRAEQRHAAHLLDLFEQHGIEAPADPWAAKTLEVPATVKEACRIAVDSEKTNAAMYDELLEVVEDPEIRYWFAHLRQVSLEHHLPAFERCVERGPGGGGGYGKGAGAKGRGCGGGGGQGRGGCCGRCAGAGS